MKQMLYQKLIKPLLFRCEPELIHELVLWGLENFGSLIPHSPSNHAKELSVNLHGLHFPNRIGLAAGMDKHAQALTAWERFGFGFVELGTITNLAQEGNAKPRLFRLIDEKSLLNRMGFNNHGAADISKRLEQRPPLKIPIGINIGKSRIIDQNDTEAVIEDYLASVRKLERQADYLAINVSSPNTPGLRDWQEPERLSVLLKAIKASSTKPVFLKISPDLEEKQVLAIMELCEGLSLNGLIACNTTLSRAGAPEWTGSQQGGISGALLREKAWQVCRLICKNKTKNLSFISVGGISSADDIKRRLDEGADLVQIYSAFVFEGPGLISKLNSELLRDMHQRP